MTKHTLLYDLVEDDEEIRVLLTTGHEIEGKFSYIDGDTLSLSLDNGFVQVQHCHVVAVFQCEEDPVPENPRATLRAV